MNLNKKVLSIVSATALSVSLLVPSVGVEKAEATANKWNTERYGDVVDIGAQLRAQSEDEEYMKDVKEKIKAQAPLLDEDRCRRK